MLSFAFKRKGTHFPLSCVDTVMSHIQSWGGGQHFRLDSPARFRGQNPSWTSLVNFHMPQHPIGINIDNIAHNRLWKFTAKDKERGIILIRIIDLNSLWEFIRMTSWRMEYTSSRGLGHVPGHWDASSCDMKRSLKYVCTDMLALLPFCHLGYPAGLGRMNNTHAADLNLTLGAGAKPAGSIQHLLLYITEMFMIVTQHS